MTNQHANDSPTPTGPMARRARRWARWLVLALVVGVAGAALVNAILADLPVQAADHAPAVPTAPPAVILLGAANTSSVPVTLPNSPNKLRFQKEDIIAFDPNLGQYSMFFDGSVYGLKNVNVEDFEYLVGPNLLIFTLNRTYAIPNPNGSPNPLTVKDSDIVAFDLATEVFSLYLRGADIGLTTPNEDIDALGVSPSGKLLISTIGTANAIGPGNTTVTAVDEDLLECDLGTETCTLYFDGSNILLTAGSEDIDSVWVDPDEPANHYLATKGSYDATGTPNRLKGNKSTAFGCHLYGTGAATDCFLYAFFLGPAQKYKANIDGLWVSWDPILVAARTAGADEEETADALMDLDDYAATMAMNDPEIDHNDFFEETLLLPLVTK